MRWGWLEKKIAMKNIAAVIMLLFLAAGNASARTIEGMVRRVYDGDTIELVTRESSRLKVRLYGIDAPEASRPDSQGQPFGREARRTLMFKVMGRRVQVDIQDSDQHNRAVAVIRYSGRDINREMLAEGMAWAYRQYLKAPYADAYMDAEKLAKSRRLGLWRESSPVPPWEFRHPQKKSRTHGGGRL